MYICQHLKPCLFGEQGSVRCHVASTLFPTKEAERHKMGSVWTEAWVLQLAALSTGALTVQGVKPGCCISTSLCPRKGRGSGKGSGVAACGVAWLCTWLPMYLLGSCLSFRCAI